MHWCAKKISTTEVDMWLVLFCIYFSQLAWRELAGIVTAELNKCMHDSQSLRALLRWPKQSARYHAHSLFIQLPKNPANSLTKPQLKPYYARQKESIQCSLTELRWWSGKNWESLPSGGHKDAWVTHDWSAPAGTQWDPSEF